MEIGIRELKAHLSEYVARVAAGEVFTVTDRGVPRAILAPVGGDGELERGLADGWVTRRSTEPPGAAQPSDPDPDTPRSEEILAADRGD
jgi:prevent-host-death family protein